MKYLITTTCLLTAGIAASAAGAQETDFGKSLFEQNCAVCHGADGGGDGPVAELFAKRPRNLKLLAEANSKAFPFSEVYQSIDGRREIAGHGTTEMPVWGALFEADALPKTIHPGIDADEIVQTRILALVYYLQSIQD